MALFLISALLLTSCQSARVTPVAATTSPVPLNEQPAEVETSNRLSMALAREVDQRETGNIWISPISVQMALRTLEVGARGETQSETKALSTPLMPANNNLLQAANAIWVQPSCPLLPAYRDTCILLGREIYSERITAKRVNQWANQHTHGAIREVLQQDPQSQIKILIANAVWFKGEWQRPFEAENTHKEPFYTADGQSVETTMLWQKGRYRYYSHPLFSSIMMPYKAAEDRQSYYLQVILPHPESNASSVLQTLTPDILTASASEARSREVRLTLPKIALTYEILLDNALQALGLKQAYTNDADFSGISTQPLAISQVKQNSMLRIDEQGTEAAAVTTIAMRATAMPQQEEVIDFQVNRPYLLLLRERESGLVLFVGKIEKP